MVPGIWRPPGDRGGDGGGLRTAVCGAGVHLQQETHKTDRKYKALVIQAVQTGEDEVLKNKHKETCWKEESSLFASSSLAVSCQCRGPNELTSRPRFKPIHHAAGSVSFLRFDI